MGLSSERTGLIDFKGCYRTAYSLKTQRFTLSWAGNDRLLQGNRLPFAPVAGMARHQLAQSQTGWSLAAPTQLHAHREAVRKDYVHDPAHPRRSDAI